MSELDLELSPRHPLVSRLAPGSARDVEEAEEVSEAFRSVMRTLAQPVAVLTGRDDTGELHGMTLTSFTSLSMDPPMLVACIASGSRTWSRIRPTGRFVLNLLGAGQSAVADSFAAPGAFPAQVPHRFTIDGLPVLAGTAGALRCAVVSAVPGGDHDVVLARITRVRFEGGSAPLSYRRGAYVAPEPIGVS